MDDSKERTAHHEAAHAVVALVHGYCVKVVRIKRDREGSGWQEWAGAADITVGTAPRSDQCSIAIAGFLAEAKWHAMKSFADSILDEAAPMESFIAQLRVWQRQRIQVRVPVLRAGDLFEEKVLVFDEDLRILRPDGVQLDEAVVAYALAHIRRVLNDAETWSAVVALAQRLLDAPAKLLQNGDAVEIPECEVLSIVAEFTDFWHA